MLMKNQGFDQRRIRSLSNFRMADAMRFLGPDDQGVDIGRSPAGGVPQEAVHHGRRLMAPHTQHLKITPK